MIGYLQSRVRKQPIIAIYFETVLKFYNLEALFEFLCVIVCHRLKKICDEI